MANMRKLSEKELDLVAGGEDAETMYTYRCSEDKGGCGITFAAIKAGTPCPHCKTTEYLIDLGAY